MFTLIAPPDAPKTASGAPLEQPVAKQHVAPGIRSPLHQPVSVGTSGEPLMPMTLPLPEEGRGSVACTLGMLARL
jgi:hypothetical protein